MYVLQWSSYQPQILCLLSIYLFIYFSKTFEDNLAPLLLHIHIILNISFSRAQQWTL